MTQVPKAVIPNPVKRGRAVISARVGVRDLAFSVESDQTSKNHKVPQGYSPAEDSAGSLTPFGMTIWIFSRTISHTGWFNVRP